MRVSSWFFWPGVDVRARPSRRARTKKYNGYGAGKQGNFSAKSFPGLLHPDLLAASIKAANNALAKNTWSSYSVIKSHLRRCQFVTGVMFKFPMSNDEVITLVAYLMARVKLKAVTIEKYLSGLRLRIKINFVNKIQFLTLTGCGTSQRDTSRLT